MDTPPPKPTPIFWLELPDSVLPPEEQQAVEEFRQLKREFLLQYQFGHYFKDDPVFPLFQAPPDFHTFIDKAIHTTLYADESNVPRKKEPFLTPNIHKPPLMPWDEWLHESGFTVFDGHIIAADLWSIGSVDFGLYPDLLGNLRHLHALRLSGAINTICSSIGRCTQLRYLNLSGNRLSTLPAEIGQCTQLEALDIERASLTSLPPEIGQLGKLKFLDLNENHLNDLPATFGNLQSLLRLDLSSNQIIEFPRVLCQLPQLEWLNLQLNQIGYVPTDVFPQFRALKEMILSYNPLRTIHGIIQEDFYGKIKIVGWGASTSAQLTPRAMYWINNYQEGKTRYDLEAYYAKSVGELAMDLIKKGELSPEETERLVHEATVDERAVLEHYLPPDHPVLTQINSRLKMPLTINYEVLL